MLDNILITLKRSDGNTFRIGRNSEWKIAKNGLDGFGAFDNDLVFIDNGLMDGGAFTASHMSKVDRTIKACYMLPSNNEAIRANMVQFFNPKMDYKVYIDYMGRTLWATGKIKKFACATPEAKNALMIFQVTFAFASQFLKSYDDFNKNIASVDGCIAFPYMVRPNGLVAGVFRYANKVELYNDGDINTACVAEFVANDTVVNPSLIVNGKYVRVIDTMQAGDVLLMDFVSVPPKITKNGANYMGKVDRTSAIVDMELLQGNNLIEYTADNGSDKLNLTIRYNKLYAGI